MIDDQNKIITVEVDKSKELNIFGLGLLLFKVHRELKVRSNVTRPRKENMFKERSLKKGKVLSWRRSTERRKII